MYLFLLTFSYMFKVCFSEYTVVLKQEPRVSQWKPWERSISIQRTPSANQLQEYSEMTQEVTLETVIFSKHLSQGASNFNFNMVERNITYIAKKNVLISLVKPSQYFEKLNFLSELYLNLIL